MRALLLAAGLGRRLGYKTKNVPKALVKIENKEILEHQLSVLRKFNIRRICIVVGYKSDKIINFIKKKKYFIFKIIVNKNYYKTDSAYSFSLAKNFINSNYIHINSDIIFNSSVLKYILKSKRKNILSCRSDLKLGKNMDLIKTINARVMRFDNKYYPDAEKKVFGLAKVSKELAQNMMKKIEFDIKKNKLKKKCFSYFKNLCRKKPIYSIDFKKENLREINYLHDIKNRKQ